MYAARATTIATAGTAATTRRLLICVASQAMTMPGRTARTIKITRDLWADPGHLLVEMRSIAIGIAIGITIEVETGIEIAV